MGRLDNTSINNTINMNLHEYQAKELLGSYGVPVQRGVVLDDLSKLDESYQKLKDETGTSWCVVKAQIHAGGRGKGGGVKSVSYTHLTLPTTPYV